MSSESATEVLSPEDPSSRETVSEEPVKRRVRRGRKRTNFKKVPRMVYPVRALWDAASEEDRTRAHHTCVAILEMWLGKTSKAEIAERLELPPLRIWQLSQRALSGMLAALVHQPRTRLRKGAVMSEEKPEEEVKALRRRIVELEKRLKLSEELNELLRQLPSKRSQPAPPKRKPSKTKGSAGRAGNPQQRPAKSEDGSSGS